MVEGRIVDPCFVESFGPQMTSIACSASPALVIGAITRHGERIIYVEITALADDLRLAQRDQRRVNMEQMTFHTCFGSQVCGRLKGRDELGPAIGVAGIIHRIDADVEIVCVRHLRPTQGDS